MTKVALMQDCIYAEPMPEVCLVSNSSSFWKSYLLCNSFDFNLEATSVIFNRHNAKPYEQESVNVTELDLMMHVITHVTMLFFAVMLS